MFSIKPSLCGCGFGRDDSQTQDNMYTSKKTKKILLIISFICLATMAAMAQGPGFGDDVADTPIDGGATLIAIAAVGYGVKKVAQKRKSR